MTTERPLIEAETARHSPDLLTPILMAIRTASKDLTGEFGVAKVSAPTYAEQLSIATSNVAHKLWAYPGNPLTETASGRLRVTDAWVAWFASSWVRQGALNDPEGKNRHWVRDFLSAYPDFIQPLKEVQKVASFEDSLKLPPACSSSTMEPALTTEGDK